MLLEIATDSPQLSRRTDSNGDRIWRTIKSSRNLRITTSSIDDAVGTGDESDSGGQWELRPRLPSHPDTGVMASILCCYQTGLLSELMVES
jgi:hypothetical protein